MDFDAFLAPLGSERFMAEYYDRRPVHIPARGSERTPVLDWAGFKALLQVRSHWSQRNIELVLNSRPVAREHYVEASPAPGGREFLADPNKVAAFLAIGASLVANSVEQIAPGIRTLTRMLSGRFAATANANLYCSFGGIQAFASHFDPHEVFALHCEGKKKWRIYENRADAPLPSPAGGEAAQGQIDRVKGGLLMEVVMRPGDLLYIPRGYFHDALASSGASLHVTLGVLPPSGRLVFRLLEQAALRDRAFRDYLPDGREEEGAALQTRLAALGERLAEIVRSPAFLAEIVTGQAKLMQHDLAFDLPDRPPIEAFARTDRPAEVVRSDEGTMLRLGSGGADIPLGLLAEEAEWLIAQPAIVLVQLVARYAHRSEAELRGLVETLVRAGLYVAYQPRI